MNDQPQRNEPMSYRYPMQQLVAVLDEETAVDEALRQLGEIGVDLSAVHILSGTDGAALLDRRGEGHGLKARLLRLLQWTSSENDTLEVHDQVLRDGGHVVYVPCGGECAGRSPVDRAKAA